MQGAPTSIPERAALRDGIIGKFNLLGAGIMGQTSSLDIQATVSTNVDVSGQLTSMANDFFSDINYWLVIAVVITMILTQVVKMFLKVVVPVKYIAYRKLATFLVAYLIGFACGIMFLEGMENIVKWSFVIGFVSPFLYVVLKSIAVKYNLLVLQSALRMRPLRRSANGDLELDETTVFYGR